jgi:hypothetical protein
MLPGARAIVAYGETGERESWCGGGWGLAAIPGIAMRVRVELPGEPEREPRTDLARTDPADVRLQGHERVIHQPNE